MKSSLALAIFLMPVAAFAQSPTSPVLEGTRLDVVATGEVTKVPDVVRIGAGVVTQAPTAAAALSENGARMNRVLEALRRAGVADRDVRTNAISLSPQYRYAENQPPALTGYQASNQVSIRFRDIKTSGAILDTLVREGANEINGPSLEIDKPEAALDEARIKALATARARGDLFARAAGMRVVRIISITDNSSGYQPVPPPYGESRRMAADAATKIVPGEQAVQASVSVTFELR